jgi:DNA recombination protein RmuC
MFLITSTSLIFILITCLSVFYFLINRSIKKKIDLFIEERERSKDLISVFDKWANQTRKDISNQLEQATKTLSGVQQELGQMQELGRQVREFQDAFRAPKLRGTIGEQILEDLLKQVLPKDNFHLQYRFKNGVQVDAIIKTDEGIIPIDAKFPLENFIKMTEVETESERKNFLRLFVSDVKRHIDNINRYILPEEGTVDLAIMYVPAEAVYYEIMLNNELGSYANNKKVIIVSPNIFYHFLKVILMGLAGRRIEETAKDILDSITSLSQDAVNLRNSLEVLNSHISNAYKSMERVRNEYERFSIKIEQMKQPR